jgi:hypothetical protein
MMKSMTLALRLLVLTLAMLAATLTAGLRAASADGGAGNADCGACRAATQSLALDPASYKLWPSGARTLLNVAWSTAGSSASFNLVNSGQVATPALNVTVVVDNHDPLSQTSNGATTYTYAVAALAPQTSAAVTVPLDYRQCDVFVTVDLGIGSPDVFRTGNPAAC